MDSFETCLMGNHSPDDVVNSQEIPDHFVCCVCLDLLYKPIVLNCGHISCFWCVHKSMNSRNVSRCPLCRNPYSHFPGICEMLHFLLLKLYPVQYKQREDQILEEEKRSGYFSPEFNSHADELHTDGVFNCIGSPAHSSAVFSQSSLCSDSQSTSKDKLFETARQVESYNNDATHTKQNPQGALNHIKLAAGKQEKVSVAELLCAACKQLLFRPVALNCGHVYCETCIPADQRLRCQVCLCLHPRGSPKVCLILDSFVAAKFPNEYALRRDGVQLKQVSFKQERASTCSLEAGKQDPSPLQPSRDHLPNSVEPGAYRHIGVGCDACGMSPIVGDRYKCKDCTEKIGFDLCRDCYNTRPKLPGRFNQRHTPEHKFECIKRDTAHPRFWLMTGQLENGSTPVWVSDDVPYHWEDPQNAQLVIDLDDDSQSYTFERFLYDDDYMDDLYDISSSGSI